MQHQHGAHVIPRPAPDPRTAVHRTIAPPPPAAPDFDSLVAGAEPEGGAFAFLVPYCLGVATATLTIVAWGLAR